MSKPISRAGVPIVRFASASVHSSLSVFLSLCLCLSVSLPVYLCFCPCLRLAPPPPQPPAPCTLSRSYAPGFVILQYLPLCLTCIARPQTLYAKISGKKVESVLPYNTLMQRDSSKSKDRVAGQERELGPKEVWADVEYHFKKLSTKWKGLNRENWDASLDHAQKVMDAQQR